MHDVRDPNSCEELTGHVNTALEIGANISPCRRYIASGSEDRSAYI